MILSHRGSRRLLRLVYASVCALAALQATAAGAQRNPYDGFEQFHEPLYARATPAYRACVRGAGSAAERRNCTADEQRRQERRLEGAYRAALARVTGVRRQYVREEQRGWLAERSAVCRPPGVPANAEPRSSGFILGDECALREIIRRTWWLERFR